MSYGTLKVIVIQAFVKEAIAGTKYQAEIIIASQKQRTESFVSNQEGISFGKAQIQLPCDEKSSYKVKLYKIRDQERVLCGMTSVLYPNLGDKITQAELYLNGDESGSISLSSQLIPNIQKQQQHFDEEMKDESTFSKAQVQPNMEQKSDPTKIPKVFGQFLSSKTQSELQKIVDLEKQAALQTFDPKIDSDTSADPAGVADHFICAMCLSVVCDPNQCQSCEKLSCKECIQTWLQKDKSCPNCKQEYKSAPNVNRFVMNMLNDTKFKCGDCKENYLYSNHEKHFKQQCQNSKLLIRCPQCGEQNFKPEELLAHLQNNCEILKGKCSFCNLTVQRGELANKEHNCIKALKKQNEILMFENTRLEKAASTNIKTESVPDQQQQQEQDQAAGTKWGGKMIKSQGKKYPKIIEMIPRLCKEKHFLSLNQTNQLFPWSKIDVACCNCNKAVGKICYKCNSSECAQASSKRLQVYCMKCAVCTRCQSTLGFTKQTPYSGGAFQCEFCSRVKNASVGYWRCTGPCEEFDACTDCIPL